MSLSDHAEARQILRGIGLVAIAVFLFAITDAISKYMTQHYPTGYILWIRFFFHTLVLIVVVGSRQGLGFIRTRRPGIQLTRGLLLPLAALMFVTGLSQMPLAETAAITFVSPFLVTLLAVIMLKEKVDLGQWLAIGFSFAGVLLIIRPGADVFGWAALLPLGTALSMAIYQVLTRRIAGLESAYTSIFYPGLVGLALFSLALPFNWTTPIAWWHVALMIVGGMVNAASHLTLIRAFDYAPASKLAPFSYTQIVWATLVAYVVFGDFPDAWSMAGIGVIAASGIYVATRMRRAGR
ncbi:MAG: DMT family transporter [Burkholderiaceae bacterium]|jgi:drug/metabolite transporter (DMT)-like permease